MEAAAAVLPVVEASVLLRSVPGASVQRCGCRLEGRQPLWDLLAPPPAPVIQLLAPAQWGSLAPGQSWRGAAGRSRGGEFPTGVCRGVDQGGWVPQGGRGRRWRRRVVGTLWGDEGGWSTQAGGNVLAALTVMNRTGPVVEKTHKGGRE